MTAHVHQSESWPPDPASLDLHSPDWLTPEQAAGETRYSIRVIWQLIADNDVSIKVGGRRFVSRKRLLAVLISA